jgi:hypothetical protein
MTLFSKRLPHVLTRKDLALIIAPTYAASANVDFDEAHERMERAVDSHHLCDQLYEGISEALTDYQGPRMSEDAVIDKLSAGVLARRSKVKAANVTPAISAALVLINLELGLAAQMMANALETDKGRALLKSGLRALGAHLLKELIK